MKMKRILCTVLTCAMLLALCLPAAFAASPFDHEQKGSITAVFAPKINGQKVPLPDVEFRIYKVADATANMTFTATAISKAVNLDWNLLGTNSSDWAKMADTLANYLSDASVRATASGETNRDGKVTFNNLEPGIYLLLGDSYKHTDSKTVFVPTRNLITLPMHDVDSETGIVSGNIGDGWDYDLTVDVKFGEEEYTDFVDISVRKIWENTPGNKKPTEITVVLRKDGSNYERITLSQKNSWYHKWEELDNEGNPTWSIVEEDVPSDFKVSITSETTGKRRGKNSNILTHSYFITNTYTDKTPPTVENTDPPEEDDKKKKPPRDEEEYEWPTFDLEPKPELFDFYDEEVPLGSLELFDLFDDLVPLGPALPQTGQLWWPVPILAFAGLLFIGLGFVRRRTWSDTL